MIQKVPFRSVYPQERLLLQTARSRRRSVAVLQRNVANTNELKRRSCEFVVERPKY